MADPKKWCESPACAFSQVRVTTDKTHCIGCGKELRTESMSDIVDLLFGGFRPKGKS